MASALTPTWVQKSSEQIQDEVTGTPVRVTQFKVKATKATQNDTIVMTTHLGSTYTTDNIIGMYGVVIPTGGDSVQETLTVDDSDDEIVLAGATTGTAYITVDYAL